MDVQVQHPLTGATGAAVAADEVARGERFAFGANWRRFLALLNEERIANAVASLASLLQTSDLSGRTFLDVGSGSGLSSLAAYRLGARIVSFDYDRDSVACTEELHTRFGDASDRWRVIQGSALDRGFMESLGRFDVVYSWGVLHHTGAMWTGIENALHATRVGGLVALAIYNDQGAWSNRWRALKRFYCSGAFGRSIMLGTYVPYQLLRGLAADLVWMRNPVARYRDYHKTRGMSVVRDWVDWLGGYPFEVAKPEAIFHFASERGFELRNLVTCGGSVGCNEFVFARRPTD